MNKIIVTSEEELNDLVDRAIQSAFSKFLPESQSKKEIQNPSEILNVQQAAEYLDLAVSTVYGLVHNSKLPHFKKGHKLRFKRMDLLKWIESGTKKTSEQFISQANIGIRKSSKF